MAAVTRHTAPHMAVTAAAARHAGAGPAAVAASLALLREFQRLQERRAELYAVFAAGFRDYLAHGVEARYAELVQRMTPAFAAVSQQVHAGSPACAGNRMCLPLLLPLPLPVLLPLLLLMIMHMPFLLMPRCSGLPVINLPNAPMPLLLILLHRSSRWKASCGVHSSVAQTWLICCALCRSWSGASYA